VRMIRYIVLVKWKKEVSQREVELCIERINHLPDECSLIYNWCSSRTIAGPEPNNERAHDFCFTFDFRSIDEQVQYSRSSYTVLVHEETLPLVDMERTVSANMLVEAEPLRVKSQI
jgi:hypothetical protein